MGYRQFVLVKRTVSSSPLYRKRSNYPYSKSACISLQHLVKSSENEADKECRHDLSYGEHGVNIWRGLVAASISNNNCVIDRYQTLNGEDQGLKETISSPKPNLTGGAIIRKKLLSLDEHEGVVGLRGVQTLNVQGYGGWRASVHMETLLNRCSRAQCISRIHTLSPHLSKSIPDVVPHRGDEDDAKQGKPVTKLEPTAEQCDEAVVDLSSAKAKAKKVQEVQSKDVSILTKLWSLVLGIGPMLKAIASMSREDWAKKMIHLKDEIRDTLKHYWVGFKLLWADTRISSRLLIKLAGGKSLTRRERRQLLRTTADIFRLVPFAVFIIVPFMEFLLPVFLKVFPNMLPSTFQDKMKEQEALKRKLNARIEYAKFLQDTVKQMAEEIKTTRSGDLQRTAEDLDEFMNKVRIGESVTNEEILGFAKLFNDELTLDNISRPRLVSMCKYMGIQPYGTDTYLRHMLRSKLSGIKNDDRMIQIEGIDSLSEAELRTACRERGMLGLLSVEEMRQQLRDWLDLSLNYSVPSSLLILSRSFLVSGKVKPEEAVQATLSSLPDEVVESVGVTALPSEDALSERVRKLEYLQKQEELIKEEIEKEEIQQVKLQQDAGRLDQAAQDMEITVAQEPSVKIFPGMQEDLCKLSSALAVLASSSFVSKERTEFLRLVNKEIALYNEMVTKQGADDAMEARKAFEAVHEDIEHAAFESKASSALVERIDAMLHNLEKELDSVDAVIGDQLKILDRDSDGKVTPEEVAAAAMFVKDTLGREPVQELIRNLAKDEDGKILVEDILRLGIAMETEETEKEHTTSLGS